MEPVMGTYIIKMLSWTQELLSRFEKECLLTALMKGILHMYTKYAIRTNGVIIFVAVGFIVEKSSWSNVLLDFKRGKLRLISWI